MNYKENIKYLVKSIRHIYPSAIELRSNGDKKEFKLKYGLSEKVAEILNIYYYFGTEIKIDNKEDYLSTLKELIKIKRALKYLKAQ